MRSGILGAFAIGLFVVVANASTGAFGPQSSAGEGSESEVVPSDSKDDDANADGDSAVGDSAVGKSGSSGRAVRRRPDVEPLSPQLLASTQKSIESGLAYLSRRARNSQGALSNRYSVAVTALGGMAFLGYGAEYNRGPYGEVLARCVEYLLDPTRSKDGYLCEGTTSTPSRMHGHAYAVLFLAQIVGQISVPSKAEEVRKTVERGINRIIASQTADGGWGYEPSRDQADEASITVCCLQALRAAKDAGFTVEDRVIEKALWYLRQCAKDDGSFKYSLRRSDKSTYELTAAAVSTLDAAGEYDGAVHDRGVRFMRSWIDGQSRPFDAAQSFPYYGNLYAAQVYHQLGGTLWSQWAERVYPQLQRDQEEDGRWTSLQYGDAYATACSVLILEVSLGYLPIFER